MLQINGLMKEASGVVPVAGSDWPNATQHGIRLRPSFLTHDVPKTSYLFPGNSSINFANEMRHGTPALEEGGGFAALFQTGYRTETGRLIWVMFYATGE